MRPDAAWQLIRESLLKEVGQEGIFTFSSDKGVPVDTVTIDAAEEILSDQEPVQERRDIDITTESALRSFIREALVSASRSYTDEKEIPKRKFELELTKLAREMAADVTRMRLGSPEHLAMIETALDRSEITDRVLRDLISRPFTMVPPAFLLKV